MEPTHIETQTIPFTSGNKLLSRSFKWMAWGLLLSAVTSFVVGSSQMLLDLIFGNDIVFYGLLLAELGLVIYFSSRINKLSASRAKTIFIIYSILSGATLTVIFFAFNLLSIIGIFLGTMAMFSVLALIGAHTKKDLTSAGRIAFVALIGIIIASIVNMFLVETWLEMIISWIGIIVFAVLTAYDAQKLKRRGETVTNEEEFNKAGIAGALDLYLDFINLFLFFLRIAGGRK